MTHSNPMSRPSNASRPWFVYLIEDEHSLDLYIGIATDVERRVREHNEGKAARRTRGRGPWVLKAYIRYENRSLAAQAEYCMKSYSRGRKLKRFMELGKARGSMCSLEERADGIPTITEPG